MFDFDYNLADGLNVKHVLIFCGVAFVAYKYYLKEKFDAAGGAVPFFKNLFGMDKPKVSATPDFFPARQKPSPVSPELDDVVVRQQNVSNEPNVRTTANTVDLVTSWKQLRDDAVKARLNADAVTDIDSVFPKLNADKAAETAVSKEIKNV